MFSSSNMSLVKTRRADSVKGQGIHMLEQRNLRLIQSSEARVALELAHNIEVQIAVIPLTPILLQRE